MPLIIQRRQASGAGRFGRLTSFADAQRTGGFGRLTSYAYPAQPTFGRLTSLIRFQPLGRAGRFVSRAIVALAGSPVLGMPTEHIGGAAPVKPVFSCVLGNALKAEYEHSGEDEYATITIRKSRASIPDALKLMVSLRGFAAFTANLAVDPRQWEESTENGVVTTTLRLYNAAIDRAGNYPLPELVPWVLHPRPSEARSFAMRQISVTALIAQAAATAGVSYVIDGVDPFAGETWQESRREISTAGRTFIDLCSIYTAAGYRFVWRGRVLHIVQPGIGISGSAGAAFRPCEIDSMRRRGEAGQVPGRIELHAADAVVPKPRAELENTNPTQTNQTEDDARASWLNRSYTDSVETITAGYVLGGLLRETQEVVLGRVEVTETIDGEARIRVFDRVLISDTRTTFDYHPDCHAALVHQANYKTSYGYTLNTKIEPRGVLGLMFSGSLSGGDVVSNETEITQQRWHESGVLAGYLMQRLTAGKRLVSVQQVNPEADPTERGPLAAREYAAQVMTEDYRKIGKLWARTWGTTGGAMVPLYDAESQEAVRLTVKTGPMQSGAEVMENEPPKVTWPQAQDTPVGDDANELQDETNYPQRKRFAVAGGGFNTLSQTFDMLRTPLKLPMLADLIAAANGPRVVTELNLKTVRGMLPGENGVTNLHVSMDGSSASSTVTMVSSEAPGIKEVVWPPDPGTSTGVVTGMGSGMATVSVLTGVDEQGGGIWQSQTAYLPSGTTVTTGATVATRVNSAGVNIVTGGP